MRPQPRSCSTPSSARSNALAVRSPVRGGLAAHPPPPSAQVAEQGYPRATRFASLTAPAALGSAFPVSPRPLPAGFSANFLSHPCNRGVHHGLVHPFRHEPAQGMCSGWAAQWPHPPRDAGLRLACPSRPDELADPAHRGGGDAPSCSGCARDLKPPPAADRGSGPGWPIFATKAGPVGPRLSPHAGVFWFDLAGQGEAICGEVPRAAAADHAGAGSRSDPAAWPCPRSRSRSSVSSSRFGGAGPWPQRTASASTPTRRLYRARAAISCGVSPGATA